MAYASVMVYIDFDAATEARVRLAAGLSDRFESTLIGIAACAPQPPFVRGGGDRSALHPGQSRWLESRA
jgi:hypothetical protein